MTRNDIQLLSDQQITTVSGGMNQVCTYEAAGKCYSWGWPYKTMGEIYEAWANRGRELAERSKALGGPA